MRLEDMALIGNCQHAALVHRSGAIAWWCAPRFDSPPVFGALLDVEEGGSFLVGEADGRAGQQRYLENTNVLETVFRGEEGSFRVLDFAPRYESAFRTFRPTMLVRVLEPLQGTPSVVVRLDPRLGWSGREAARVEGSHHVRYEGFDRQLRLTTDLPLSYINGQPFALTEKKYCVLTWGSPIEGPIAETCEKFLARTLRYWREWVKRCNVPPLLQDETIRSALVLKLHCFEDTGAIVAATTTSIPESPGSGRTWDYRYCWLRDAYYVLAAFRRLGQFEEREQFTSFLANVAASSGPDLNLAPLYRVDGGRDLEEQVVANWKGYCADGPVRVGNAAATQVQHDVHGEMVLALAPVFLDERFRDERSPRLLRLLRALAEKAVRVAGTPDAGIWEVRRQWDAETFSTLMCWAGADRCARVLRSLGEPGHEELAQDAARIKQLILDRAWSDELGSFSARFGGNSVDAALLHVVLLRFLPAEDERVRGTLEALKRHLAVDGWLFRYREDDGLGRPALPFTTCTFWLSEALAVAGRAPEAMAIVERAREAASPLGLLSEHHDPVGRRLWGNYPQAYSHAGFINAIFQAAPSWADLG